MLRNAIVSLAIVLIEVAFARGEGFRGSPAAAFGGTPANHGGHGNRASGYGSRDMWGHILGRLWAHDFPLFKPTSRQLYADLGVP